MRHTLQNATDLDHLSASDKAKVLEKLNEMQVQDSMNTYNGLVETCFKQCVTHFKAKDLDKEEEACVGRCVQKFMAYSQRVGQRFADVNRHHE